MNDKTARERMNQVLAHQRRKLMAGRTRLLVAQRALKTAEIALNDAKADLESIEVLDLDMPDLIAQVQTLQEVLRTSAMHIETIFEQVKPL